MARRGKCAKLFSDNGKNFVGASNEIKKLLEIVKKPDEKLANYLAAEGIEWKFIPARSLNSLEEPNLTKCKESNLKKWQKITKIVQLMWKFWSRNYLNQLQQRGKWMFEKNNVKIGDLVLIIEENLPTYKWALGRIVELYYGEDKKVRVVKIKTQYTTCKRAISKICVLPMEDP
ncbi:integrase catalytic domain-containing protein [Trichonephila clavipes]|nr:integrase catalytic domain-containing protein [Trichonephila clavipes]